MQHLPVRRAVAGLAGAVAVLALSAAPAAAAPSAEDISIYLPDVTTPAGANGAVVSPTLWSDEEITVGEPKLVYKLEGDVAGLSLANVEDSTSCEVVSATELSCADWFEMYIGPYGSNAFEIVVKADDSAQPGDVANLTATFSGQGVEEIVATSKVRVAEAVDLTAGGPVEVSAAPGGKFTTAVSVFNSGDKPVTETGVIFYNDYAIESPETFSNCLYSEGRVRSCTFDETVEVGTTYAAKLPYQLGADTLAPGFEYGEVVWLTGAELADWNGYLEANGIELGAPGTGEELSLAEVASRRSKAAPPQADANPNDNWSNIEVNVTGKNGADLAAFGSEATGKAGDEVTVTAGVRNVGKAAIDMSRVGSSPAVTSVYAPEGTSFSEIPEVCNVVEGNDGKVDCWFSDYLIVPGDEETYEFKLHLDEAVSNAKGDVVVNEPCECERFLGDINLKNNKAAILINKAGGAGGGTGGDDPSLPVTGPAGITLGVSGLALLVLGAGGFVLARRRRMTFTS